MRMRTEEPRPLINMHVWAGRWFAAFCMYLKMTEGWIIHQEYDYLEVEGRSQFQRSSLLDMLCEGWPLPSEVSHLTCLNLHVFISVFAVKALVCCLFWVSCSTGSTCASRARLCVEAKQHSEAACCVWLANQKAPLIGCINSRGNQCWLDKHVWLQRHNVIKKRGIILEYSEKVQAVLWGNST